MCIMYNDMGEALIINEHRGIIRTMVYLLTEEDCEDILTNSEISQSIVSFFREQEGGGITYQGCVKLDLIRH